MGWLFVILFALLVLGALWRLGGVKGSALSLLAVALLAGAAGYAWQGSPGMPGSPTPPRVVQTQPDSAFATERARLLERFGSDAQILEAADAMHRAGLDAYGIGLIRGGIEKHPGSADLWVGLGNALTLYADGVVTPAAELAFNRAAAISPEHPGPPYFLGLALAQAGQIERASVIWSALLARSPPDAPWRGDLERRIAAIAAVR